MTTSSVCSPCLRGTHRCTVPETCTCPECHPAPPEGFAWEDPPPRTRVRIVVGDSTVKALRSRPGQWARVKSWTTKSTASAAAKRIRDGKVPGLAVDDWEAEGRTTDGGSALWLRFVGSS